jgi:hypothetical protein
VGSHLGWHSTMCWPLRGGRGTYTQKTQKIYRKKKCFNWGRRIHPIFLFPSIQIQKCFAGKTTRVRRKSLLEIKTSKIFFWCKTAGNFTIWRFTGTYYLMYTITLSVSIQLIATI